MKSTPILMVKTGTYFGECLGYCNDQLVITPERILYSLMSNVRDKEYPDITSEISIKRDDWNSLIALIDFETLVSLPDTIGCPDCADQGGEWIEISDGQHTKRVDFEFNASVHEIDDFVKYLRRIRTEISRAHRP